MQLSLHMNARKPKAVADAPLQSHTRLCRAVPCCALLTCVPPSQKLHFSRADENGHCACAGNCLTSVWRAICTGDCRQDVGTAPAAAPQLPDSHPAHDASESPLQLFT